MARAIQNNGHGNQGVMMLVWEYAHLLALQNDQYCQFPIYFGNGK